MKSPPDLASESVSDEAQSKMSGAPFISADRFRVACRMLRQAGFLDDPLQDQRAGESPIDWLVRHGLAPDPHTAAEMLILGRGLRDVLDELTGTIPEWSKPT